MKRFLYLILNSYALKGIQPVTYFFSYRSLTPLSLFSTNKIILPVVFMCSLHLSAQQNIPVDTAYQKVIAERSAKIVNTLAVKDAVVYKKVQQHLIDQYIQLNAIQDGSKSSVTAIKAKQLEKDATDAAIKNEEEKKASAETSHATTHAAPTYIKHEVVHYCVANMPGAVARTSTFALGNVTLPFILALADKGPKAALAADPHLLAGLNVHRGRITHSAVAEALGLPVLDARAAIA